MAPRLCVSAQEICHRLAFQGERHALGTPNLGAFGLLSHCGASNDRIATTPPMTREKWLQPRSCRWKTLSGDSASTASYLVAHLKLLLGLHQSRRNATSTLS